MTAGNSRNGHGGFCEARQIFGQAREDARLNAFAGAMQAARGSPDPEATLREAMRLADEAQTVLYAEVFETALDLLMAGADLNLVAKFFHQASSFGELRLAARMTSDQHLHALLKSPPTFPDASPPNRGH